MSETYTADDVKRIVRIYAETRLTINKEAWGWPAIEVADREPLNTMFKTFDEARHAIALDVEYFLLEQLQ